jgi:selenium metabolism protein YedF
MNDVVDARGLACPEPVVMTRQALRDAAGPLSVLVDNPAARDNVTRFAASRGCRVTVGEEDHGFRLEITPGTDKAATAGESSAYLFVISGDFMGKVEGDLGRVLIKAFLNTLAERDDLPSHLVLFNTGVALACGEAETLGALKRLEDRGVTILACGTCLDFLGLKDTLQAGTVSNMYEIVETLASTEKCIAI